MAKRVLKRVYFSWYNFWIQTAVLWERRPTATQLQVVSRVLQRCWKGGFKDTTHTPRMFLVFSREVSAVCRDFLKGPFRKLQVCFKKVFWMFKKVWWCFQVVSEKLHLWFLKFQRKYNGYFASNLALIICVLITLAFKWYYISEWW